MNMKIIYPTSDGGIAVIHPSGVLSVEQTAEKDVPRGVPYKLLADDAVPADREFRGAWEADFSSPDGHGAGYTEGFSRAPEGGGE